MNLDFLNGCNFCSVSGCNFSIFSKEVLIREFFRLFFTFVGQKTFIFIFFAQKIKMRSEERKSRSERGRKGGVSEHGAAAKGGEGERGTHAHTQMGPTSNHARVRV